MEDKSNNKEQWDIPVPPPLPTATKINLSKLPTIPDKVTTIGPIGPIEPNDIKKLLSKSSTFMTTEELKKDILNDKNSYGSSGGYGNSARFLEIVLSINYNTRPLAKYLTLDTLIDFWVSQQWYKDAPENFKNEFCNINETLPTLIKGLRPEYNIEDNPEIKEELIKSLTFVFDISPNYNNGTFNYFLFDTINRDYFNFKDYITRNVGSSTNMRGESYEDYLKVFLDVTSKKEKGDSSLETSENGSLDDNEIENDDFDR